MQLEDVRVEGQSFPAGELAEVSLECRIQLPVVDRTSAQSAGNVAENFARVDEAVLDAHRLEAIANRIGLCNETCEIPGVLLARALLGMKADD